MMVGTSDRGYDVKSGIVDVAGLDAIDAVNDSEQMIVIAD